jgi:hypothetical protein
MLKIDTSLCVSHNQVSFVEGSVDKISDRQHYFVVENVKPVIEEFANLIEEQAGRLFAASDSEKASVKKIVQQLVNAEDEFTFGEIEALFYFSMQNFSVFWALITSDLSKIEPLLRFALMSRAIYNFGPVACPANIEDDLNRLLKGDETDLYAIEEIGQQIFNLRDALLANPTIDKMVLIDRFNNTGDLGDLSSIIANPTCPRELLRLIQTREHECFQDGSADEDGLEELVDLANELLEE